MPPQNAFDPGTAAQDKDFLNASLVDKTKYLSAMDANFAKASPAEQRGYIAHLAMNMQFPNEPQEPSALSRLTSAYNPGADEFAAKHPILGPIVRGLDAAGGTALSLPSSIYHAVADPVSPEEAKKFGSNADPNARWYKPNMSNIGPVGRGIVRIVGEPPENAASFYAGKQDIKPTVRGIASVLPEALGTGIGTVGGVKAPSEALRTANRIIPSTTRAGVGLNMLTDSPDAIHANVPVETPTTLAQARKISNELAVTGEKPHAVIQHYLAGEELRNIPPEMADTLKASGIDPSQPMHM